MDRGGYKLVYTTYPARCISPLYILYMYSIWCYVLLYSTPTHWPHTHCYTRDMVLYPTLWRTQLYTCMCADHAIAIHIYNEWCMIIGDVWSAIYMRYIVCMEVIEHVCITIRRGSKKHTCYCRKGAGVILTWLEKEEFGKYCAYVAFTTLRIYHMSGNNVSNMVYHVYLYGNMDRG